MAETMDDVRRLLPRLAKYPSWRLITFVNKLESIELARTFLPERLHTGASLSRALGGCALVCDELNQLAAHNADESVLNLWRRSRHVGLSILGGSQAPTEVHPVVRGMSRFLVLFHLHEPNALAYFARVIPPAVLEEHSRLEQHECLVWDAEQRCGYVLDRAAKVRKVVSGR